ncbi:MAG: SpoIIE family protein phosphatase [Candidatus Wallbacteria bacterium]|nr:SpoIIE family protein phosphatase [Candidatus Wallbacteria bacterium]
MICRLISGVLTEQGYQVTTASSGEEGLKLLSRFLPHAILCDIVMPGMDGYEFCRRVKARTRTKNVPVILLTSKSDPRDKVRGLEIGAADYVTKPFDAGELRARLAAHLRIVTLQQELRNRNRLLTATRRQLEEKVHDLSVLEQKRQKALDLAYKVQLGLLPSSDPAIEGFGFGSRFLPADNIAGDFYDYIPLDGQRWGIAIGDVAGKGLPASLLMVLTKTLLRTEAIRGLTPGQVLENVNRLIINSYGSAEAVTLFYGILDPTTNSFTFSNGGHEFPIVYSARRGKCTELSAGGPFLGIFQDARYNEGRIYLTEDDLVLLYTDGLFHLNVQDRPIGTETVLKRLLLESGKAGTHPFLSTLLASPPATSGADDVTIVAMRCHQSAISSEVGYLRVLNSEINLKDVRDFTAAMASHLELEGDDAYTLIYAVDEAATNAVVYAYPKAFSGFVDIVFHLDRNERVVTVEVVDHGHGPPRDGIASESMALDDDPLSPRGRGFVLMDNLMATCDIIATPGGGTTVRMTKRLSR